ncbi:MAG: hypothetical protein EZS28_054081, partial [Streblomastix strix]
MQPVNMQDKYKQWTQEIALPVISYVAQRVGLINEQSNQQQQQQQMNIGQGGQFILPTTLTGLIRNIFSHISVSKTKQEFGLGIARGLGANDGNNQINFLPLGLYLSQDQKQLIQFEDKLIQPDIVGVLKAQQSETMLQTSEAQGLNSLFQLWIERGEHFLLVGPEGAGKHMLLRDALKKQVNSEIAE